MSIRNFTGDTLSGQLGNQLLSYDQSGLQALGSTEAGRDYVYKALNPSAPMVSNGIPDMVAQRTVKYHLEQAVIIDPPAGVGINDLVNYEINFHGHPIALADVIITTSSAPNDISNSRTILNANIEDSSVQPAATGVRWTDRVASTTASYISKTANWIKNNQRSRCIYAGVTLIPSTNDNSNQGSLFAGQQQQQPVPSGVIDTQNGQIIQQFTYGGDDFMTVENLMNHRRAYANQMKNGVYIPLKLNDNYQAMVMQNQPTSIYSSTVGTTTGSDGSVPSPHMFIAVTNGTRGIPMAVQSMGQVFIRGCSPATSFTLKIIIGFETVPFSAASTIVFATDGLRLDTQALEMYSRLLLEIEMDAYPADWNAFEWLGQMIKKVAPIFKKALPILGKAGMGALQGFMQGGGPAGALMGGAGGLMGGIQDLMQQDATQSHSISKRPRTEVEYEYSI